MTRKPGSTGKHGRQCSNKPIVSDTGRSDEEYRVGPGRPPKEFQFKPGQSGNPKGARRKAPSIVPDLKAVLERALCKRVTLRQGDREQTVTMAMAGIEHLVAQFAKGDRYARRDIIDLAQKLGVDLTAGQGKAIEEALKTDLTADDEALLADYLQRHRGQRDHGDVGTGVPHSKKSGDTNPRRKQHGRGSKS
jgi:Family of unknown function (DUF5681)